MDGSRTRTIGHYINGDLLAVGKAVCPHLEAALNEVFLGLTRIEKAPAAGKTSARRSEKSCAARKTASAETEQPAVTRTVAMGRCYSRL